MFRRARPIGAFILAASLIAGGVALASAASDMDGSGRAATGNADKLDGMDSKQFAYAKGKTRAFDYSAEELDLNENGYVDTIAAAAQCPSGTQATGGGGADFTATGVTFINAPYADETWLYAVWIDEQTTENPDDVYASIVCYSPHGKDFSNSYRPMRSSLSKSAIETLRRGALPRLNR